MAKWTKDEGPSPVDKERLDALSGSVRNLAGAYSAVIKTLVENGMDQKHAEEIGLFRTAMSATERVLNDEDPYKIFDIEEDSLITFVKYYIEHHNHDEVSASEEAVAYHLIMGMVIGRFADRINLIYDTLRRNGTLD
jgi:hypothetical protein